MSSCVVVVADGARARLFALEADADLQAGARLIEKAKLVNNDYLAHGEDAPQVKTERNANRAQGPMQTQSAMRDRHRVELEHRFARDVATQCAELLKAEQSQSLVLVAGARTLGFIREPLQNHLAATVRIQECPHNYTRLSPYTLLQRLTERQLLPQGARPGLRG